MFCEQEVKEDVFDPIKELQLKARFVKWVIQRSFVNLSFNLQRFVELAKFQLEFSFLKQAEPGLELEELQKNQLEVPSLSH